jgi:hypothetical protein
LETELLEGYKLIPVGSVGSSLPRVLFLFIMLKRGLAMKHYSPSNRLYCGQFIASTIKAGLSAGREALKHEPATVFLANAATESLKPMGVGACLGLLFQLRNGQAAMFSNVLVGSFIGGVLGFVGGMLWKSRTPTKLGLRAAINHVGFIRDQRWLERHPITYA